MYVLELLRIILHACAIFYITGRAQYKATRFLQRSDRLRVRIAQLDFTKKKKEMTQCCLLREGGRGAAARSMCTSVIGGSRWAATTRKLRTCPRWRAQRTPIPFAAGEARADHAGRRRRARVGVRRGAAGTRMGSAAHTRVRRTFHPWANPMVPSSSLIAIW